jgi:hypothetical protein
MPQDNIDMGIDKAGPKVHDTGPYDEDKVDPDDLHECEGCGGVHRKSGLYNIEDYGCWCYRCLDKRLKVE